MPKIYGFNDFIKHIYGTDESIFTCVVGKNETGKTDFNLLQFERIHDLGLGARFGSNMKSLKADFEIDYIEDFDTLEKVCMMLNPSPKKHGLKKYFFFLSEIGKFLPRDQGWKNLEFIEKLQTVRKYGLCCLTDAIDRVDARVLSPRFFAGIFEKPFKRNKRYAKYEDWSTGRKFTFKDIPPTKIEFDTYEIVNFYMKPQGNGTSVPLTKNDEIAFKYLDNECSWKKAGIDTQTGKRAVVAALKAYRELLKREPTPEPVENNTTSEPSTEIGT